MQIVGFVSLDGTDPAAGASLFAQAKAHPTVLGEASFGADAAQLFSSEHILAWFDGTLYNAAQLAHEHSLPDNSSCAQLIAAAFCRDGASFVQALDGEFALAIFDRQQQTLLLARDRLGSRPIYYCRNTQFVAFSSALRTLADSGLVEKVIDREALSQFFQLTYIPSPRSILRDVRKVPAASVLTVRKDGAVSCEAYWDIRPTVTNTDYNTCKQQLRTSLTTAVDKRMHTGKQVGAFLSGGFDSTIVVGLMASLSETPVRTFTVGYNEKDFDESELAQVVADKHQTDHTRILLDWEMAQDAVQTIFRSLEEPFADSSLISTYMVCKKTGEHAQIALTGDAGDELFAGYNKYLVGYYSRLFRRIPRFITNGIIRPLSKCLPTMSIPARKVNKFLAVCDLDIYEQRKRLMSLGFKQAEVTQLMRDGFADDMSFIRETYEKYPDSDEQTRAQYVDMKIVLEGCMLPKVYIAAALSGFETCAPLLDTQVVELAFSMPSAFKIKKKKRKIILKDTFNDLIPPELYKAPKHGFSVPIGLWLKTHLKKTLYAVSDTAYLQKQGLFSPDYIQQIVENHMSGKENRTAELWTFLVFQMWYDNFMHE